MVLEVLEVGKADYLATHQLDKHVEGGWFQISTWGVGEVFQDVLQSLGLKQPAQITLPERCLLL